MSFEVLPLIEFHLEEGIEDKEAMTLIESSNSSNDSKQKDDDNGGSLNASSSNVMTIESSGNGNEDDDPFSNKYYSFQQDGEIFSPVTVNRAILSKMEPGDVIVFKWQPPLRYQFFRNILPEMSITKCDSCNRVFHTDDYELQLLQKGHCPFCRHTAHFLVQNEDAASAHNF